MKLILRNRTHRKAHFSCMQFTMKEGVWINMRLSMTGIRGGKFDWPSKPEKNKSSMKHGYLWKAHLNLKNQRL